MKSCFPSIKLTLWLGAFVVLGVAADYNRTTQLYRDMIDAFDHRIRPTRNSSLPTTVFVRLNMRSLREIVETEQYIVINAWVDLSWQDEIRIWDPDLYDGVNVIHPDPNDVWRPRILTTNSIFVRDLFDDDYAPLGIFSDGSSGWYPGTVFFISCSLDMTYFPFDRQTCALQLLSQMYAYDVVLEPASNEANIAGYSVNGEWELESTQAEKVNIRYRHVDFTAIFYTFVFKRRPEFYAYNFLVPVALLTFLAPLVFVLPEDSGERVSYSVTLLLSLALFMGLIGGELPRNSETMPIAILYLLCMIVHSGLCAVCCILHLRWRQYEQTKKEHREELSDKPSVSPQTGQLSTPSVKDHASLHPMKLGNDKRDTKSPNSVHPLRNGNYEPGRRLVNVKEVNQGIDDASESTAQVIVEESDNGNPRKGTLRAWIEFLLDANIILCVTFYVVWFGCSIYFAVRLM